MNANSPLNHKCPDMRLEERTRGLMRNAEQNLLQTEALNRKEAMAHWAEEYVLPSLRKQKTKFSEDLLKIYAKLFPNDSPGE